MNRGSARSIRTFSPTVRADFSLPAQFERYTIVAVHDRGYAEVTLEPSQQPGELALKDWARIDGRLVQSRATPSRGLDRL